MGLRSAALWAAGELRYYARQVGWQELKGGVMKNPGGSGGVLKMLYTKRGGYLFFFY